MLTLAEKLLFPIAVLASLYLSYITFGRMWAIIQQGQGELQWRDVPRRIRVALWAFFLQDGIIRRRTITSIFHYFIAWGFIFYLLVNAFDVIEGYVPGFHPFGTGVLGGMYRFLADVFSVSVIVGMTYFLVRRFILHSPALSYRENIKLHPKAPKGIPRDSLIVGLFILFHVGSRFLSTSFRVALEQGDPWQPFASWVAHTLWSGLSPTALTVGMHVFWWFALGSILAFLPYFPYSKHAHLFMGPFNWVTRPERPALGALDPIDFEDESIEEFGAAKLTDLPKTQIVDAFACIMCNRCQESCPAYLTGKELSPAALEINKRYYTKDHFATLPAGQDEVPLLDYALTESALWACTTCGACVDVCPVGNEPMFDILEMRRHQVLMEGEFPHQLRNAFNGMARVGNPWSTSEDRLAWTEKLDFHVPTVEENPDFDVLYWVGCAGAFDPDGQKQARSIATILHKAGVNFAILGNLETCTGDAARRAGSEDIFYELALGNIETLKEVGAEKKLIITGCPHCMHTIGKEYKALGGDFRVMHYTEYVDQLLREGRIAWDGKLDGTVTFHDPCYLGRHNGVYDAPRDLVTSVGFRLVEMEHHGRNSFCCGAGGAQFWKEEEPGTIAVSMKRYQEAQATQAEILAVACPFCFRMLSDANNQAEGNMQVKDIAQLLADALQREA
ncbi:MAG: (Fe-S)-binding protein [Chloroflexi bacterium]|nr:(Fe-S)-binding protein [Chloroflexota bacterium]